MSDEAGDQDRPARALIEGLPRLDAMLRNAGFITPIDRWQNIADLLLALAAQGHLSADPAALRPYLAPLLCGSPEEQRRFPDLFQRWLHALGLGIDPQRSQTQSPPAQAGSTRGWRWRITRFGALAACTLLILFLRGDSPSPVLGTERDLIPIPELVVKPVTPPTHISVAPHGTEPPPVTGDPPEDQQVKYIQPWTPPLDIVYEPLLLSTWQDMLDWIGWMIPRALALALLVWLFLGWWRWSATLRGVHGGSARTGLPFDLPNPETTLLEDDLALDRDLRRLHRPVSSGRPYLRLPATVEATARHAGLYQPVYRIRMRAPELLVLLEARYAQDQMAEFGQLLIKRLRAIGFPVRYCEYGRDIERLTDRDDQDQRRISLASLAQESRSSRLLIIGEPSTLMGPDDRPRPRLMHLLSDWPQRALLVTRLPPDEWTRILHAAGLPLADFSSSGLRRLIPSLLGEPGPDVLTYVLAPPLPELLRERERWTSSSPPPPQDREDLIECLHAYLKPDGGDRVLTAMAFYPVAQLALTLALDRKLFPYDRPEWRERRILTLARLPWCRLGWLPNWLKRDLVRGLSPRREQAIKQLYQDLLLQARPTSVPSPRSIPIGPDTKDGARAGHRNQPPASSDLLRSMRALAGPRAPVHDPMLSKLLFSKATRMLDLALPRDLAQLVPNARVRALIGRLIPGTMFTTAAAVLLLWVWQCAQPTLEYILLDLQRTQLKSRTVKIDHVSNATDLAAYLADVLRQDGFATVINPIPLTDGENGNTIEVADQADMPAAELVRRRLEALSPKAETKPLNSANPASDNNRSTGSLEAGELQVLIRETGMPTFLVSATEPPVVLQKPIPGGIDPRVLEKHAAEMQGTCHQLRFDQDPNNPLRVDDTLAVRSLRQGAPVYVDATSSKVRGGLPFGEVLDVIWREAESLDEGRLLVKRPHETDALGWMERTDLLCRANPLRIAGAGSLERQVLIRLDFPSSGAPGAVQSYPGPAINTCDGNDRRGCRALSRFDLLNVYAEDRQHNRLLLAFEPSLNDDEAQLVGWVSVDRTIAWPTRYGLRPADNTEQIWLYPSWDAAYWRDPEYRYPVKGNQDGSWYTYPMHLPLIARESREGEWFYKVAAPGPKVNLAEARLDAANAPIMALKGVDVLFLIDGSRALQPSIKGVADAVAAIADRPGILGPGHAGNHYRFGYRIYRNAFADADPWNCEQGVCEGLPLDRKDCGIDAADAESSAAATAEALRRIAPYSGYGASHPQALVAGIEQSLRDLGGCDKRLKLLIVIGELGGALDELPAQLRAKLDEQARDFLVIFLQIPPRSDSPAYQAAYVRFGDIARKTLGRIYPKTFLGRDLAAEDEPFLRLGQGSQAAEHEVMGLLHQYTSSKAINEVLTANRSGEALDDFLSALMNWNDLPVVFLESIESKLCNNEEERSLTNCTEPVQHVVEYAYAPISDEWIEEAWLDIDAMNAWLLTLRRLGDVDPTLGVAAQRRAFVDTLLNDISQQIGEPAIPDSGETLGQFVQRTAAMPLNEGSPLLGYTLAELRQIEPCELTRLRDWAQARYQLLSAITTRPQYRPEFRLEDYPDDCPRITDNGRRIRRMEIAPPSTWESLGADERASYEQPMNGVVRYWLPLEYLP